MTIQATEREEAFHIMTEHPNIEYLTIWFTCLQIL